MREPIYKGATRPAMKAGVPLMALVGVFMPILVVAMWLTVLVNPWTILFALVALVILYVYLRLVTRKDDQRLYQTLLRFRLHWRNRNQKFWQSRSYSAHRPRDTK